MTHCMIPCLDRPIFMLRPPHLPAKREGFNRSTRRKKLRSEAKSYGWRLFRKICDIIPISRGAGRLGTGGGGAENVAVGLWPFVRRKAHARL